MSVCVCLFPRISISFACTGQIFCRFCRPMGMVLTFKKSKFPRGGVNTTEPMWTFDIIYYITQNYSSL